MANPDWQKGMISPNITGRPRRASQSTQRILTLFLKRQIGGRKLDELYNQLKPVEKILFLKELFPYVMPKLGPDDNGKGLPPFNQLNIQIVNPVKNAADAIKPTDNGSIPETTGQ